MRFHRSITASLMIVAALIAGCSSSKQGTPRSPSPTRSAEVTPSTGPAEAGVSPGGVTTSLSAPAGSTEEEYYLACHWARVWMNGRPGNPHDQIEPYLAMVQKSQNGENGTWNIPWAKLPAERQSAVIVAAKAAADGGCD